MRMYKIYFLFLFWILLVGGISTNSDVSTNNDSEIISGFQSAAQNTLKPGSGFIVGKFGSITEKKEMVISGRRSFFGVNFENLSYSLYLNTDPAVIPFEPGRTYKVIFDYKIISTPDKGFEVLFFSSTGAGLKNWMPSKTIIGIKGDIGTAELINTLGPYADYQVFWNVIGKG